MTSSINDIQQEIIKEFASFGTWEEKYKHIIKVGKKLESLPEDLKIEDLKVKGCQSQVWLKADLSPEGLILLRADSDAVIVKGLIGLLLRVYSGQKPSEVLNVQPSFIEEIGLASHLSASRANGLLSMVKQIKYYAKAFEYLASINLKKK